MTPGPEFEPGPHWWEASALTTAPPLLSHEVKFKISNHKLMIEIGRYQQRISLVKVDYASSVN